MSVENATGPAAERGSGTSSPSLRGPVTGGRGVPYASSIADLDGCGYTEYEYLVSGRAATFQPLDGTAMGQDGRWTVVPGQEIPYTTRILVRRPDSKRFNGTVVVEFMQEYFGTERDTNFRWNAETLLREGFAWVGASLHHEGVDARGAAAVTLGDFSFTPGPALIEWDPDRYRDLSLPSSDLCYDVLSQIGHAVGPDRPASQLDPLAGLKVDQVFAVGNTIAAARLQHYINGVHPVHQVFDGFYLQDLTEAGVTLCRGTASPAGLWLRTDVDVPTMVLNTMTAAVEAVRQPEGRKLRFWEPAGSSHTTGPFMAKVATATKRDLGADTPICPPEYANTFPLHYISGSALMALQRWVADEVDAPSFPRIDRLGEPPQATEDVDDHGNAVGGLRSPWVDVPIARYDWRGECLGGAGRTYPFTPTQLTNLYGEPQVYHERFEQAVREAQRRGVLLAEDAQQAIDLARKVTW